MVVLLPVLTQLSPWSLRFILVRYHSLVSDDTARLYMSTRTRRCFGVFTVLHSDPRGWGYTVTVMYKSRILSSGWGGALIKSYAQPTCRKNCILPPTRHQTQRKPAVHRRRKLLRVLCTLEFRFVRFFPLTAPTKRIVSIVREQKSKLERPTRPGRSHFGAQLFEHVPVLLIPSRNSFEINLEL